MIMGCMIYDRIGEKVHGWQGMAIGEGRVALC